jgi:hypothetical protein
MFESAFDLSRFKEVKGKTPKGRAEDVKIRNGQLSPAVQLLLSVATMIEYPTNGRCLFSKISYLMSHLMLYLGYVRIRPWTKN